MKSFFIYLSLALLVLSACKKQDKTVSMVKEHHCANCNMIVEKYPSWVQKAVLTKADTLYFDGARCMFKTSLEKEALPELILVRDYYTQKYIDGKAAWYVIGSDVLGPMGNELVPFGDEAAAKEFLKEHAGERIVRFDEVDLKLVMQLAKGMQM